MNDCKEYHIPCKYSNGEEFCKEEKLICNLWRKMYEIVTEEIKDIEKCPLAPDQYCLKAGKGDPCDGAISDCNNGSKIYSKLKQIENFGNLSEALEKQLFLDAYLNLE